jgi:hypothetical protein
VVSDGISFYLRTPELNYFRASPWLSEQTNAEDMRQHRFQSFYIYVVITESGRHLRDRMKTAYLNAVNKVAGVAADSEPSLSVQRWQIDRVNNRGGNTRHDKKNQ